MEQTKLKINMLSSIEVIDLNPDSFVTEVTFEYDEKMVTDYLYVEPSQLMLLISELTLKLHKVINTTPRELIIDEDSAQGDGVYSLYMAIKQAALLIEMNKGIPSDHLTLAADQLIDSIPELFSERSHKDPTPLVKEINPTLF